MENLNQKVILIVDDDRDITQLIEVTLKKDGFSNILKVYTGQEAIALCEKQKVDLVILDIMLPDIDGIEVCKAIRKFSYCSIIFLSAKNDEIDKILGLSSGADDYVTKPFSPKEIAFRAKAQLRRQQYQSELIGEKRNALEIGNLMINLEEGKVLKENEEVELTGMEFQVLTYMVQNIGKIISKEQLYEGVWGEYSSVCDNTIMVHIRHLREKLENEPSRPRIIVTVKGLGYKLVRG